MRLPTFRPRIFYSRQGRYLRCLVRDKLVRATPEEAVRQRVLAWLIREKRLSKGQLKLEDNLSYANRRRGRPDIAVFDDSGKCRVIVEVKRSEDVAGYDALRQAQRYARRLAVAEVWVTNGDRHAFARRVTSGTSWREVRGSRILRAQGLGRLKASRIPNPRNQNGVRRYLRLFPEFRSLEREKLECVLTLRRLLQQPGHFFRLPYSHNGLHIIADRDMSPLVPNTRRRVFGELPRIPGGYGRSRGDRRYRRESVVAGQCDTLRRLSERGSQAPRLAAPARRMPTASKWCI